MAITQLELEITPPDQEAFSYDRGSPDLLELSAISAEARQRLNALNDQDWSTYRRALQNYVANPQAVSNNDRAALVYVGGLLDAAGRYQDARIMTSR